jgi:hypothetical protein
MIVAVVPAPTMAALPRGAKPSKRLLWVRPGAARAASPRLRSSVVFCSGLDYDAVRMNGRYLSMLGAAVLLGAAGCHGGPGSCAAGDLCECRNGTDCYQGCADGDGCDLYCHHMVHCGGVCGHGCLLECHDVIDCSSSCGDDCSIDCHNTTSCGALCGANCQYACQDVDRCGVQAGPGSSVACDHVTSCVVDCLGTCRVACSNTERCDVACLGGGGPLSCTDGSLACGSC